MMRVLVCGLLLLLSGCSFFYNKNIIQNRETEYLKARCYPPIAIPPGLCSSTMEPHYPIPPRAYQTPTTAISLIPPELYPPVCPPGEVPKRS